MVDLRKTSQRLHEGFHTCFHSKWLYITPALFCFALLGLAFGMQWFGGMMPCTLCVWSRWVYLAVGVGFLLPLWGPFAHRLWGVWIPFTGSGVGVGLSLLHSLVERKLIVMQLACVQQKIRGASVELLRQFLQGQDILRCDKIEWSFFGVTLPNMNILIFSVLMVWAVWLWTQRCRHV